MDTTKIEIVKQELQTILQSIDFKETIIIGYTGKKLTVITNPADELFQSIEMQRAIVLVNHILQRITGAPMERTTIF